MDLGDRTFEVIHTLGHSPGGIGLIEHATGICCRATLSMTDR
jgi:glyoxylase-like metal-dependent hydrolase (beta-lactamase superfamily II)